MSFDLELWGEVRLEQVEGEERESGAGEEGSGKSTLEVRGKSTDCRPPKRTIFHDGLSEMHTSTADARSV